jgi:Spy/CpxP family protein refolding chaperone
MNRVLCGWFTILLLIIASHQLYAEPRAPIDSMGRYPRDESMQWRPLAIPHGMERADGMPEAGDPPWRHLTCLGLDENQKESIKEIRSRVAIAWIKKSADEHVAGIELKSLFDKEPADMRVIEAKLKQIATIKTEMHLSFIKAMEEIKSKLTPDQRKKFKQMLEMDPMMRGIMIGHRPRFGCEDEPIATPHDSGLHQFQPGQWGK